MVKAKDHGPERTHRLTGAARAVARRVVSMVRAFPAIARTAATITLAAALLLLAAQLTGRPAAQGREVPLEWHRCGGPLGGLGYDVRMVPASPDTLFVTDAWAGVFVSRDGGANWGPSSGGITTRTGPSNDAIPVFCLTIDPHDSDIIWAGTQYLRGIFRSDDGGISWNEWDNGVEETEGITFRGFTVDPRSSDIVYAAAEVSSWQWSADHQPHNGREFDLTEGVVYKTVDRGRNWTAVWRGKNLARYIWIDPQRPTPCTSPPASSIGRRRTRTPRTPARPLRAARESSRAPTGAGPGPTSTEDWATSTWAACS